LSGEVRSCLVVGTQVAVRKRAIRKLAISGQQVTTGKVLETCLAEVFSNLTGRLFSAGDFQVSVVHVRDQSAIFFHPSRRPPQSAKLVADVVEPVNAGD